MAASDENPIISSAAQFATGSRGPRHAKRTDTSDGTEGIFTSLTFINAAKRPAEIAF